MNISKLATAINIVMQHHSAVINLIGRRLTQVFEIGTLAAIAQHYRANGYIVQPVNLDINKTFKAKVAAAGYPGHYSAFRIINTRGVEICHIYQNVPVQGHGAQKGCFCLDVAVLKHSIPLKSPPHWKYVGNSELVTFAESKFSGTYPMMIAHFIGIVHELAPGYLHGQSPQNPHLAPLLLSKGSLSPNITAIVGSFKQRRITIRVENDFDNRLARLSHGSPFP